MSGEEVSHCQWDLDCREEATHYLVMQGVVRTDHLYCAEHAEAQVESTGGNTQAILIEDWKKYLEKYSWQVFRLSVAKMEILTDMGRKLIPIVHDLAVDGRRMYFNFYFADHVWYMKLGLLNFPFESVDDITKRAHKEFGARVSEEDPDLRLVDGEVMEDIKVLSCETFFQILEQEALTPKQAEFYMHFLFNMMGFNYDMELDVALNMAHGVRFRRAN